MQHQRIRDEGSDDRVTEEQTDGLVLEFMLGNGSWPWTISELARELGDDLNAIDSVARLTGTGLAHRCGDLVFPSRAARRAAELEIGTA
jgi:hypothetical protein